MVLLWQEHTGHRLAAKSALDRLWYPEKASVSFEDILALYVTRLGGKGFSATPHWDAHTRKYSSPSWNGKAPA
jgi:hypothetical protein